MKTFWTLLTAVILASGCRYDHLGDQHGKAYSKVVQDQIDSEEEQAPLDAEDSRRVMKRRHEGRGPTQTSSGATMRLDTPQQQQESSSDRWEGSRGKIELRAK